MRADVRLTPGLTRAHVPTQPELPGTLSLPAHLGSQVVARGQVLEAVQAVPVASSSTAGVVVDHLGGARRGEAGKRGQGRYSDPGEAWRALG